MILLWKHGATEQVADFWTISLIHSFGKLISKTLAHRLAPHMQALVQPSQSAFIKGCIVHDNFKTMQSRAHMLHARKRSSVLIKIDIAKAFDTIGWVFLIDLLHHLGFSHHWMKWISILLSTTSTWVLLNGWPGHCICHARGLRQGDPLSPLIFMLVIEALNGLFQLADCQGPFAPLRTPSMHHRL
jgi:hypothetical protein